MQKLAGTFELHGRHLYMSSGLKARSEPELFPHLVVHLRRKPRLVQPTLQWFRLGSITNKHDGHSAHISNLNLSSKKVNVVIAPYYGPARFSRIVSFLSLGRIIAGTP